MQDGRKRARFDNVKRKVLVVEDELINREILGFMLMDHYDVLYAETGQQALEQIQETLGTLSLVLLDVHLPDMKGTDILRDIRSNSTTALLPVIVMTADQDSEVECLGLGAMDFISKPYPRQEIILARIQRTIELYEDRDLISWTERDQLTGLYNREFFFHHASQFDTFHPDTPTDAITLDINHFHMINERFGRKFGDEVLKRVSQILIDAFRESGGIVCRREADSFLVYCPHRNGYQDVLDDVCVDMGQQYQVRARMGLYSNVDRSVDVELRFDRAKQAADTVRKSYTGAIGVYDKSMHEKKLYDEQLLEDFPTAIRERQLTVYYQPKVDIRTATPTLCGAEALVRWIHPKLGFVSPGAFIPLFEKNGLIRELDLYVWREAAAQAKAWKDLFGRSIPVSVNVSRIDLSDPLLPEVMYGIVTEAGLDIRDLHLEVTESAYTEDADQIVDLVKALQAKGFYIEMDDFGTGYSSLNMVTTMPIDALKLDMSIIRSAFAGETDTRLVEAIIGLAHSLEFTTIAEGVETMEQLDTLRELGCDNVQGYVISKPLPAHEFQEFAQSGIA